MAVLFASIGTRLTGASAATANIPVPSGVTNTATDCILAFVYMQNTTVLTVTPPTGFTEVTGSPAQIATTSGHRLRVYEKRPTGADAGTYNFTLSGTATWRTGYAVRYTGCIATGSQIDTGTSPAGTTTNAYPNVSLTTTGPNELIVWAGASIDGDGGSTGGTPVPPAGYAVRVNANPDQSFTIVDLAQAAQGSTGTLTATQTGTFNSGKGVWLGALKPPAAAVAAPRGRSITRVPIIRSNLY